MKHKVLILGIDGMDPKFTKKLVSEGKLPNIAHYIENGSSREDLSMLGGTPTITPPMWTTLATGASPATHGITCFWNQDPNQLDHMVYNLYSSNCKAEQLWNVTAEAGLKTLVWHWPGSAWPPSSNSENLYVVDGTSPGSVGMSTAQVEGEYLLSANTEVEEVTYRKKAASDANAACVITGLELDDPDEISLVEKVGALMSENGVVSIIMDEGFMTSASTEVSLDLALSPVKAATGWKNAPANAKEFIVLFSGGLIRRPALILADENGKYTKVAIYKNKNELDPIVELIPGVMARNIIDEAIVGENKFRANRSMKLLELDESGDKVSMYISPAMDIDSAKVYHPQRL